MAMQAGAVATTSIRIDSEKTLTVRRSITFYLRRGLTFQNRRPERNPFTAPADLSALMQLKIKCNRRDHVHRPTPGRERPHAPLFYGRNRSVRQRRRATKNLVHFDASILRRAYLESHDPLHAGSPRNFRICRRRRQ